MNTNKIEERLSLSTPAKRRMRTTKEETSILENYYKSNPNPTKEQKQEIAKVVQMGERNVHFWFQNRRAKDNKRRKLLKQQHQKPPATMVEQKLPPISTIMIPDFENLSISFYFHHPQFGIENSMMQWLSHGSGGGPY